MYFFHELVIFWSAKKWQTLFSTFHPLSPVFFATATVVAFVQLHNSRFNFHCYRHCEATPTQKSAWKWHCNLSQLLAQKITKGNHLCKPFSLNRPIGLVMLSVHCRICLEMKDYEIENKMHIYNDTESINWNERKWWQTRFRFYFIVRLGHMLSSPMLFILKEMMPCTLFWSVHTFCKQQIHHMFPFFSTSEHFPLCLTHVSVMFHTLAHLVVTWLVPCETAAILLIVHVLCTPWYTMCQFTVLFEVASGLSVNAGLFFYSYNPQNSDMDYRMFNMSMGSSYIYVCIHMGGPWFIASSKGICGVWQDFDSGKILGCKQSLTGTSKA